MKQKYVWLAVMLFSLLSSIIACSVKTNLHIEDHVIRSKSRAGEVLTFESIEDTRELILATHAEVRSEPPVTFTLPVKVGSDILDVRETYPDNQVLVDVYHNDILEISVEAGMISPINNFRGL